MARASRLPPNFQAHAEWATRSAAVSSARRGCIASATFSTVRHPTMPWSRPAHDLTSGCARDAGEETVSAEMPVQEGRDLYPVVALSEPGDSVQVSFSS